MHGGGRVGGRRQLPSGRMGGTYSLIWWGGGEGGSGKSCQARLLAPPLITRSTVRSRLCDLGPGLPFWASVSPFVREGHRARGQQRAASPLNLAEAPLGRADTSCTRAQGSPAPTAAGLSPARKLHHLQEALPGLLLRSLSPGPWPNPVVPGRWPGSDSQFATCMGAAFPEGRLCPGLMRSEARVPPTDREPTGPESSTYALPNGGPQWGLFLSHWPAGLTEGARPDRGLAIGPAFFLCSGQRVPAPPH